MSEEKKLPIDKSIITDEERQSYENKAQELSSKLNSKVHVCVMFRANDPEFGRIVAYIKEPEYVNKLMYMDKVVNMGQRMVADEIREKYLIREESSPETYSDHQENDRYKIGVVEKCLSIIMMSQDVLKKN